ncbi:hypothetical protein [Janthinobacterium sp. AD80]|uniref:hypothetical protein n=1 Tax=Janthinobacterium sp. AD80 TaxID=1528773 RepID=UPI0015E069EF|nr:hypothetical protein [Janthinobacterium sp. AD80]
MAIDVKLVASATFALMPRGFMISFSVPGGQAADNAVRNFPINTLTWQARLVEFHAPAQAFVDVAIKLNAERRLFSEITGN